ncbi:MAG TPA: hypothetical protein VF339_13075 [Gammaproteobacteria bacterium]
MHWSPDVLTAMTLRGRRLHDPAEQNRQRQPQRAMPARGTRRSAPNEPGGPSEPGGPDYGCVDWFVYDEEPAEQDNVV